MGKKVKELSEVTTLPIQFDTLSTVKFMQLEHGVRGKDYARYRKFCARKLRRTRKGAKNLEKLKSAHDFTNDVWASLLLVERAWAMAQECQFQLDEDMDEETAEVVQRRREIHARKRLVKASVFGEAFLNLMQKVGGPITSLDAEAYYFWMSGEAKRAGGIASEAWQDYARTRSIYKVFLELGLRPMSFLNERLEVLSVRMQICEQEMEDVSRAEHNVSKYTAKIESMKSELKAAGEAQNPIANFVTLDWFGEQIMLTENYAQRCFRHIDEVKSKLSSCDNPQKVASTNLKLMHLFFGIQNDPKLNKDQNVVEYAKFYYYIHNLYRYWTILTKMSSTKSVSPAELEEKWKDYNQTLTELSELKDWSQFSLNNEIKIHERFCETMRAYLVGQSHFEAGNNLEAYSIGSYAEGEAQQLLSHAGNIQFEYLPNLVEDLTNLCQLCGQQRICGKAEHILSKIRETDRMQAGMRSLGLVESTMYLKDRKNDFSFGSQQDAKLIEFPLQLQPLLPDPCFIDCARLHMSFPNLEDRFEKEEQTGSWLGGWFG